MSKKKKLRIKQQKFANEYIITGNAYKTAIEARYSENHAKGNVIRELENVSVNSYLDNHLEKIK